VEYISDIPLIDVRAPSISDKQRMIKRLFDLAISSVAITLSAPIMLLIAILIKLDSPGPILFRQKRVGENTQPFEMLKFRTMIQDAEKLSMSVETVDEHGNIIHKHRHDPRVTRVGYYLRRFSIDELPQLFNVLLGKMSIVGPRPEMPCMVEKYKYWQYARFTIPQGMTGWWQVTGRSDKPMHINTEDDMYYIQNYSLWLDLRIIWKTFAAVLKGKGAF
jgi:exopolysaccharide biosynthesis polyprenyl glycosylphosphotransferase